jgi:uncharacterized protein (DUF1330 family)
LEVYTPKASASIQGRDLRILAAYGPQEVWEGPAVEGVVLVEFPTMEAAKDWYNSPAYREAREHRFKGADYQAILVEGL